MEKQHRDFLRSVLLEYPQSRPRESCEEIIVDRRLDVKGGVDKTGAHIETLLPTQETLSDPDVE